MADLSILIPSRNEEFLANTVEDILSHIEGDTEIIVVIDGQAAGKPVPEDKRVTTIYLNESIGQRAATNLACRLSTAKYVMKCDAHCAFDQGFDVKMMREMLQDNWTMVPIMRNLHCFDWVCAEGHRRYQSPSGPCNDCGKETTKDIVWYPKPSPQSTSYRFDNTLHFQYFAEYAKRPEAQGDIVETMSLQGSCFMMTREKYWELDICDEGFGSWGQQGVEVACKTWLSGGRVVCNKKTWYAHMFRTQGGDFGFPYELTGAAVDHARKYSRELFMENKWDKAIHPLSWLIEKFSPVPGWDVSRGAIYYTDNKLDPTIMQVCQDQIKRSMGNDRIVSASLQPIGFGDNIHLPLERGYLTMFKQILAALEALDTDIVFFTEHDVLYHPTHFDFVPPRKDTYYYNTNVWKIRPDGHSMRTDDCRQLSGLCVYRELAVQHYRERVRRVEAEGFSRNMGFEPGTHNRKERVDDFKSDRWESEYPNLDIRHNENLTQSRWSPDQFRDKRYTKGWQESTIELLPGWQDVRSTLKWR